MQVFRDDSGITWDKEGEGKQRIFIIPESNLPTFQDKLTKMVKRATKLQVEPPSYTVVHQDFLTRQVRTGQMDDDGQEVVEERITKRVWITLQHPKVVIAGFRFISKLEHSDEGNVLHTLPGETVPFQYRECAANCDHCQLQRRRNDTFVLLEEATGTYKQIGRNCLALYLGLNAERYADAAELYASLGEMAEASESYGEGGGGGSKYEMLDRYLSYVAEVIAHVGWKSRSSANNYGGTATADMALFEMGKRRYDPRIHLFDYPTAHSAETAKEAIQWAEELTDFEVETSDYLHNLRVIARLGVVGGKQFGYAASIVSSYQKHLGTLQQTQRQQQLPSHWVGEKGDRRVFHLLVDKVLTITSDFGTSQLHLMSDDDANQFTWFAHQTLETGKQVYLKGTIKDHKERNGVKQTILSRCEVVEMKTYLFTHHVDGLQDATYEIQATSDKDAKQLLFKTLEVKRLPKGMTMTLQETST